MNGERMNVLCGAGYSNDQKDPLFPKKQNGTLTALAAFCFVQTERFSLYRELLDLASKIFNSNTKVLFLIN